MDTDECGMGLIIQAIVFSGIFRGAQNIKDFKEDLCADGSLSVMSFTTFIYDLH